MARPLALDIPAPEAVTAPVAALAAGVSVDCLRAWLRNDAVTLLVPRAGRGAWLRVAPVDVVRLAVLGRLVQFGFTVAEAAAIVRDRVDRQIEGVVMVAGDCPWPLLASQFHGRTLLIARDRFGSATVSFGRFSQHAMAALHLNLGAIVAEARRRVREHTGSAA